MRHTEMQVVHADHNHSVCTATLFYVFAGQVLPEGGIGALLRDENGVLFFQEPPFLVDGILKLTTGHLITFNLSV